MERLFLHDEIAAILTEGENRWMEAAEIARLVNERGQYKKTARAKTTDVREFQIRLRARNYPGMFETEGIRIRLARRSPGSPGGK